MTQEAQAASTSDQAVTTCQPDAKLILAGTMPGGELCAHRARASRKLPAQEHRSRQAIAALALARFADADPRTARHLCRRRRRPQREGWRRQRKPVMAAGDAQRLAKLAR